MVERILVLGGYGVFGGRLTRRLASVPGVEVVVAGRSLAKAQAHCAAHGGTPLALDRDGDLSASFNELRPTVVVDAAGPFQSYSSNSYKVALAAIEAGTHYIDLADDAAFVAGIIALDGKARAAGLTLLSGASSVPALSAAALDTLCQGMSSVAVVGSAILPGNRAPRGLSVVRAIVAQAGKPFKIWRGGRSEVAAGWSGLRRLRLNVAGTESLGPRLASLIGAPDLLLFPQRYSARSVLFHAGLELRILHLGLWLMALPVRAGLVGSLTPTASALKWIADRLEWAGSDRGGMVVYAIGRQDGRAIERRWSLIAAAGDGPEIPAIPAFILTSRLIAGSSIETGARSAAGAITLEEFASATASLRIRSSIQERPAPPLLERVLLSQFAGLPEAWRRLAEIHDVDYFTGEASVERGNRPLAKLIACLFGFPPATDAIAVTVEKRRTRHGERWKRTFGRKSFVSHLSRRETDAPNTVIERFGPFAFRIRLSVADQVVSWPVVAGSFYGLTLPRWLLPVSTTSECIDADGRFTFDVLVAAPFAGEVVRYRGWLEPSR